MMLKGTEIKEYIWRWASAHAPANPAQAPCGLTAWLYFALCLVLLSSDSHPCVYEMLMYKLYICAMDGTSKFCWWWWLICWAIFCMVPMHMNTLKEVRGPKRWATVWGSERWRNDQGSYRVVQEGHTGENKLFGSLCLFSLVFSGMIIQGVHFQRGLLPCACSVSLNLPPSEL